MKEFRSLKILDKFKRIFVKQGINYEVMRKIIQVKLTLDSRRQTVQSMQNPNADKEEAKGKNYFVRSLIGYAFTGVFSGMIMLFPFGVMLRYSLCLGIAIFMIAMSLVADFSSVLLDLREKQLLGSKPIDDKTANAARFIHITIYLFLITLVFAGPMTVISFFKDGVVIGLMLIGIIIIADISVICFTGLFYLVFLRFFSGEKLKDIINYVQIFMSIVIIIGYQLVGRAFNMLDVNLVFNFKWWQIFLPSVVLSAPVNLVANGDRNVIGIIFTVITVLLPMISIILYTKVIIPNFEKNLFKLATIEKRKSGKKVNKNKASVMGRLFCRDRKERIIFDFTKKMVKSDRKFKQSIYPSMAMAVVFPFIFMLTSVKQVGFGVYLEEFYDRGAHFYAYFGMMMMCPLISMVAYSEKYKGAWIYDVLPIEDLSIVRKGSFKSFVVNFFYVVFLCQAIIFVVMGGIQTIPDLIAMFMGLNVISLFCYRGLSTDRPFSVGYGTSKSYNIGTTLLMSVVVGVIWAAHYFSKRVLYGNMIFNTGIILVLVISWMIVFGTGNRKVKQPQEQLELSTEAVSKDEESM